MPILIPQQQPRNQAVRSLTESLIARQPSRVYSHGAGIASALAPMIGAGMEAYTGRQAEQQAEEEKSQLARLVRQAYESMSGRPAPGGAQTAGGPPGLGSPPTSERERRINAIVPALAEVNPELALQFLTKEAFAQPKADTTEFVTWYGPEGQKAAARKGSTEAATYAQQGWTREKPPASKLLDPEVEAQKIRMAAAGRAAGPTTNVYSGQQIPGLPDPPKGQMYGRNEDGTPMYEEVDLGDGRTAYSPVLIDIPGGGPEQKREAEAAAAEVAEAESQRKAVQVVSDIDEIERIQRESNVPVTGLMGAAGSQLPFGPARSVRVLLNGIEANLTLENLNKLRQSSASGASGLGQVTKPELDILRSTYGDLSQAQDEEQFNRLLSRLKGQFKDAIYGPSGRFGKMNDEQLRGINPESLSESGRGMYQSEMDKRGGLAAPPPPTEAPSVGATEGGYVFQGGDPGDPANWTKE